VAVAGLQVVAAVWLTDTHTLRETDRQHLIGYSIVETAELKNDVKCQTFIIITMLLALAVCGECSAKRNGMNSIKIRHMSCKMMTNGTLQKNNTKFNLRLSICA